MMALRKLGRLTKVSTKAGLAGGSVYIYYEAGLWKSSDETIANYEKFKKDNQAMYDACPADVKKWVEYSTSTVSSNVEPYVKTVSDFRKEWLNFDLSWLTESGDGIIKPTWNTGVRWTIEAVADSPQTIQKWSSIGWQKVTELSKDGSQGSKAAVGEVSAPSMKQ